jgi:hypothetical protein
MTLVNSAAGGNDQRYGDERRNGLTHVTERYDT